MQSGPISSSSATAGYSAESGESNQPQQLKSSNKKDTSQAVEAAPPTVFIQPPEALSGEGPVSEGPVISPGMSINRQTVRLVCIPKKEQRYVDWIQVPITFPVSQLITPEQLNNLDYQVVCSDAKVEEKIKKAGECARISSKIRVVNQSKQTLFIKNCQEATDDSPGCPENLTAMEKYGPWGGSFVLQNAKGRPLQDLFTIGGLLSEKKEGDITPPNIGIYDGHGSQGEKIAGVTSSILIDLIHNRIKIYSDGAGNTDTVLWNAHKTGFSDSDRNTAHFHSCGTTVTISSFYEEDLWTAHAGDSHQLLVHPDGTSTGLTEQASAKKQRYHKQIERRGGQLDSSGTRIRNPEGRILAVARSIGDFNYQGCVTPRPKIVVSRKPDNGWNNHFLLLGSDGFWKVTSDENLCAALKNFRERGYSLGKMAKILGLAARAAGSADDISVAIADLQFLATGKKSAPGGTPQEPPTREKMKRTCSLSRGTERKRPCSN